MLPYIMVEKEIKKKIVRIVAGVVVDDNGNTLLVRKTGTNAFMQPGGKPELNESHLTTLNREIQEELGCQIHENSANYLGQFRAIAANETGWIVEAELYKVRLNGEPTPSAEIAEIVWVKPANLPKLCLAPLTETHVLPLV